MHFVIESLRHLVIFFDKLRTLVSRQARKRMGETENRSMGETVTGRWYFVRLGCFARLWASGYGRDATEE